MLCVRGGEHLVRDGNLAELKGLRRHARDGCAGPWQWCMLVQACSLPDVLLRVPSVHAIAASVTPLYSDNAV